MPHIHLWINEQKVGPEQPVVEVFESEAHLLAELHADVAAGRRCFVTSNSKAKIERIAAALAEQFGAARRIVSITSATINSDVAQEFLSDITAGIRAHDVILT